MYAPIAVLLVSTVLQGSMDSDRILPRLFLPTHQMRDKASKTKTNRRICAEDREFDNEDCHTQISHIAALNETRLMQCMR